jgi:hypothetical protein
MVTRTVLPVLTGTCHQPAALLDVEHRLFLEQADRGTMAILVRSDPKELPTASGIRRVEVWGFQVRDAVTLSDHLRIDAV